LKARSLAFRTEATYFYGVPKRVVWGTSLGVAAYVLGIGGSACPAHAHGGDCDARAQELQASLTKNAPGGSLTIRTEQESEEVLGEISFTSPDVPELHRKVRGTRCDEVLDALSFAYQVHLERWQGPASSTLPNQAGAARETNPRPDAERKAAPSELETQTEGGAAAVLRKTKLRIAIGPTADWTYAQDMALGVALAGHLRLWKHHWLGLTFTYAQTGFFQSTSNSLETGAVSLDLAWVASDRVGASPFHLGLEFGPRLSLLDVSGPGSEATPGLLTSLAVLALIDLSAEITPRLELQMTFGGAALLATTHTAVGIDGEQNFQQPHVGGTARFGVLASF
jgi:hypothetical protein